MEILAREFRWQGVWWFLSLGRTTQFFRELWVPIDDAASFQKQLRTQLTEVADEHTHYQHPQVGNALVRSWLTSAYGGRAQQLMVLWAEHVYINGGPDRIEENLWAHITSAAAEWPLKYEVPSWAEKLLVQVRATEHAGLDALDEKLNHEFECPQSEWDRTRLPFAASDEESVRTTIHLIVSCNIFVASWEQHCASLNREQLQALYELAHLVAKERNLADHGVAYPGRWRFELSPFLVDSHGG